MGETSWSGPENKHTLHSRFFCDYLLPSDTLFKNIAGEWDCVAAVERLPAFYYSEYSIFLSFRIMNSIVNFETIIVSLMRPNGGR